MNINARSRSKHSAAVILYAVLMAVLIIGIIAAWIIVSGRNRIALDEIYGNVIVERSGGQISAKQGMRLESGDCIKTMSGGSARITLGRDRYIYTEPDSAVTVTRSKEDKSFEAELLSGAAAVRLDKAADIKVSAPNVLVTASGSVFRVSCTDNAAEVICADGEADISGGGTSQKLAAGSLARLTSSGEITLTREEAEVSALPESALKSLMRIASQRSMTFSLNSLGGAYLALDDNESAAEISEAVSESIAETTVSETTVSETETSPSTASETETSPSEKTTETTSETVTEISETSVSEANTSETTTFETTFSETTFSETTASQTTASETQTSAETVPETTAPTAETTQTTTPTIPWWEIINSAERDSR